MPSAWNDQLAEAFAILLGHPLSDHDPNAVYAAFFGGNFLHESEFDRDAAWLEPAALSGERLLVDTPFLLFDAGEQPIAFSAADSVFEVWDQDGRLPAEVHADLDAAYFWSKGSGSGLIRGRDLGTVLARHGAGVFLDAPPETWYLWQARMASDGTLLDALRAAVGLGSGPESLAEFDGEAEEKWEEALAAVPDERLRNHLKLACQEGWSGEGLSYLGDQPEGGPLLADQGCRTIAAWADGSGQVDIVVVKLSDIMVGSAGR